MAGSDAESQVSEVSLSQGFQSQEDDEETLWEVVEITGEKPKQYKVRWSGLDPKTMKPWAQSWVPKQDCTDDLVIEWKRKKKEKERLKSTASRRGRESTISKTGSRGAAAQAKASTSTSTSRRSTSTIRATKINDSKSSSRRGRTSATDAPATKTVTPSGKKVKIEHEDIQEESNELEDEARQPTPSPKRSAKATGKGKKRKLAETDSTNNSANFGKAQVVDEEADASRKNLSDAPPKKRRKVEVEIAVKPEPDAEVQDETRDREDVVAEAAEEEEESYPIAVARGKLVADEAHEDRSDEEERMVQDALSEGVYSRSPSPVQMDFEKPTELQADKLESEDEVVVSRKPPSKRVKDAAQKPASKSQPATKTKTKAMDVTTLVANTPKFGPPKGKRRQKPAEDEVKDDATPKPKPGPKSKTKEQKGKGKAPTKAKAASVISLTSDSEPDGPPPRLGLPTTAKHSPPKEERSVVWDGGRTPLVAHPPNLSPAALARLAEFDREVLAEEEEEETQPPLLLSPNNGAAREKSPEVVKAQDKGKGRANEPLFLQGSSAGHSPPPRLSNIPEPAYVSEQEAHEEPIVFKPIDSVLHRASPSKDNITRQKDASVEIAESHQGVANAPKTSKLSSSRPPSAAPTNASNGRRKIAKPPANTLITDVISETENEASQSQSQEFTLPPTAEIDLSSYPSLQLPQPPATPGRSTLRSRMKGRTPSRASSVLSDKNNGPSDKEKGHRPMRMLSPSDFHPLPPIFEPDPSLPESIIEDDSLQGIKVKKRASDDLEPPISSIEDFDSPEQPAKAKAKVVVSKKRHKESATEIWESEVVQRGQQLAEAAKRRTKSPPRPRKTLEEIRAIARGRSASNVSRSVHEEERVTAEPDNSSIPKDVDEDMVDVSTAVVPPASGPRDLVEEEDSMTVEAMEEAFVDLQGGHDLVDPILLRHEEEESTQDLMMELDAVPEQRGIDLDSGWGAGRDYNDVGGEHGGTSNDKADDAQESVPNIVLDRSPALQASIEGPEVGSSALPTSRSGSHVQSAEPLPSTTLAGLDAVRSSLEAKLEEIASLQAQLASERAKNNVLQEEVLRLQPQIIQPNQLEVVNQDRERLAELEEQGLQFAAEKAEWEIERSKMQAQLDAAEKAKVDAAKDRDFFREQYAQASGFVSSVRDENKDLEKRIKIAEEQASTGVALVKSTFQARIAELDKDVASWRMMAEFLVEKDKRTGNDDLRRRAAEQPELKRLCRDQAERLAQAQTQVEELNEALEDKEEAFTNVETELTQWKTETARLNVELNEALTKLDKIGRSDISADESMDGNGHEFVYCCQWRTEDGACREVFSTISELEEHLFSGGHIQRI